MYAIGATLTIKGSSEAAPQTFGVRCVSTASTFEFREVCAVSLHEAFSPDEARPLIDQLEIHGTPQHDTFCNLADIEQRGIQRQHLSRRIAGFDNLTARVAARETSSNAAEVRVHWQFTSAEAQVIFERLAPVT